MGGNVEFIVDKELVSGKRIHTYDITDTLRVIAKIIDRPYAEVQNGIMGSGYKTESSGDIDIALDENKIGYEELLDYLNTTYDFVKLSYGLKMIHLLVPIEGKHSERILKDECNGWVQVDLMFGDVNWLKFSHYSEGNKSKYKGKFRTALIMSVALVKTQFTDFDENEELLAKVGLVFNNQGLATQKRLRRKKKNGDGYVKAMARVEDDDAEWSERYGNIVAHKADTINPDDAAELIFGKNTKAKDIRTFEQVKKLVRNMPNKDQFLIDKLFHQRIEEFSLNLCVAAGEVSVVGARLEDRAGCAA